MDAPHVYTGIPPERWAKIQTAAVAKLGVPIPGDGSLVKANVEGHEVDFTCSYVAGSLAVLVTKKPFFVSAGLVYDKLTDWIATIQ